jgi:hypothetical protein
LPARNDELATTVVAIASQRHAPRHLRPAAPAFLAEALRHGVHLGGTTTRLLHLLDQHGAAELDVAIAEAHARGAFAAQSIAHILDQRARKRGTPPSVDVVLPDDPRVRDLVVVPHSLDRYDRLSGTASDTEPEVGT